jgi:hypothetical protein
MPHQHLEEQLTLQCACLAGRLGHTCLPPGTRQPNSVVFAPTELRAFPRSVVAEMNYDLSLFVTDVNYMRGAIIAPAGLSYVLFAR